MKRVELLANKICVYLQDATSKAALFYDIVKSKWRFGLLLLGVSRLLAIVRQTFIAMNKYRWRYMQFAYANNVNYCQVR